jgi:hypothetical protein
MNAITDGQSMSAAIKQDATPADEQMEKLFIVLSRKLNEIAEQGGTEGRWAARIQADAYEEVFGEI